MLRLLRPRLRSYRTFVHHRPDRLESSVLALQRHPRTMSSAASSSQPLASALQNGPHAAGEGKKQQTKEKKDKAQSAASQYPLEVRPIDDDDALRRVLNDDGNSFNRHLNTSISGFDCLNGCKPSATRSFEVRPSSSPPCVAYRRLAFSTTEGLDHHYAAGWL